MSKCSRLDGEPISQFRVQIFEERNHIVLLRRLREKGIFWQGKSRSRTKIRDLSNVQSRRESRSEKRGEIRSGGHFSPFAERAKQVSRQTEGVKKEIIEETEKETTIKRTHDTCTRERL